MDAFTDQIIWNHIFAGCDSRSELTPDQLDHKAENQFLDNDDQIESLPPWYLFWAASCPTHIPIPATAAPSLPPNRAGNVQVHLMVCHRIISFSCLSLISPIKSWAKPWEGPCPKRLLWTKWLVNILYSKLCTESFTHTTSLVTTLWGMFSPFYTRRNQHMKEVGNLLAITHVVSNRVGLKSRHIFITTMERWWCAMAK